MLGTYIGGSGWDLVEEVVEADGALEDAMEERARGVLGAVPEVFHHVVARVVLAAVEQRHRRVEPSAMEGKPKPKDRWLRVVVVCGHHWLRACPESESAARWVAKYLATRPAKLPGAWKI